MRTWVIAQSPARCGYRSDCEIPAGAPMQIIEAADKSWKKFRCDLHATERPPADLQAHESDSKQERQQSMATLASIRFTGAAQQSLLDEAES